MINKISLYNAPYEISSADRFFQDVDTKLSKYHIKDYSISNDPKVGNTFAWTITTTTSMTVTLNDGDGRGSYIRVEGDMFPNKPVSYWFLTSIEKLNSSKGTMYDATLDAVATFGDEIFRTLNGKNIRVERLHQDRYTFDGTYFHMVKDNYGLLNTDFKLSDTKGMELVYDGSTPLHPTADGEGTVEMTIEGSLSAPTGGGSLSFSNSDTTRYYNNVLEGHAAGIKYYTYAFLQFIGSPIIYDDPKNNRIILEDSDTPGLYSYYRTVFENIDSASDGYSGSVVIPVSNIGEILGKKCINTITTLRKLQDDKILNIIKIPFPINNKNGNQILFNNKGGARVGTLETNTKVIFEGNDVVDKKYAILPDFPPENTLITDFDILNEISCFSKTETLYGGLDDFGGSIGIETSKLNPTRTTIMDTILGDKVLPAIVKRELDNDNNSALEVGLLNSSIMPINFKISNIDKEIDMWNYFNNPKRQLGNDSVYEKFYYAYTINEMGVDVNMSFSQNQYVQWSENEIMSFSTNQGSTYLARHKYTIDATKKSIDVETDLATIQAKSSEAQAGAAASNVASTIMSFGASLAGNSAGAAYAGQEVAMQPQLANAKKAKIQGEINDSFATAPTLHNGSGHNLANLNGNEFKHNFNWVMKKPNKIILDKIVNFYDRHGYSYKTWIDFDISMLTNRSRFNYLEIESFKDYVGTFGDFNVDVLKLVDSELKKGLRLWHTDTIDYDTPNLEKVIADNI